MHLFFGLFPRICESIGTILKTRNTPAGFFHLAC